MWATEFSGGNQRIELDVTLKPLLKLPPNARLLDLEAAYAVIDLYLWLCLRFTEFHEKNLATKAKKECSTMIQDVLSKLDQTKRFDRSQNRKSKKAAARAIKAAAMEAEKLRQKEEKKVKEIEDEVDEEAEYIVDEERIVEEVMDGEYILQPNMELKRVPLDRDVPRRGVPIREEFSGFARGEFRRARQRARRSIRRNVKEDLRQYQNVDVDTMHSNPSIDLDQRFDRGIKKARKAEKKKQRKLARQLRHYRNVRQIENGQQHPFPRKISYKG
jgi:hypothetical protein